MIVLLPQTGKLTQIKAGHIYNFEITLYGI